MKFESFFRKVTREEYEDIETKILKGGKVNICRCTIILDGNHYGDAELLSICSQDTSKVEQFILSIIAPIEYSLMLLGKASPISKREAGPSSSSSA
jgi:hypothetical protein